MNKYLWAVKTAEVPDFRFVEVCPCCGEETMNSSICDVCGFGIARWEEQQSRKEAEAYLKLEQEWG